MKIKEGYILDEIGDQKVAISLKCGENDFSEMIKLNEIGAFLWEKLSEEIEEEKLVEAVTEAYDIDSATARKDIRSFTEIIYIFLTIFLYLLKCPQSLILSALRAFCFCGKPHISRSIFLYFRYQAWLKSW